MDERSLAFWRGVYFTMILFVGLLSVIVFVRGFVSHDAYEYATGAMGSLLVLVLTLLWDVKELWAVVDELQQRCGGSDGSK